MNVQEFDFSADLLQALLWQYNDAAKLQAMLTSKQAWYDAQHAGFWNAWIADVFDLTTANEFGLCVWAKILGLPLVVQQNTGGTYTTFGFGVDDSGFTQGGFGAGSATTPLTTEQMRTALRLRYFQLTTRATVPEVNAFLADLFGPGQVYVTSGGMACTYVFATQPSSALQSVLTAFDLLPRPAGVTVNIVVPSLVTTFGFGANNQNFTNGNFH